MPTIKPETRDIMRDLLNGMTYPHIATKYGKGVNTIRKLVNDVIADKLPELYANLSSDGKITVKELRDHKDYINTVLAMDDV